MKLRNRKDFIKMLLGKNLYYAYDNYSIHIRGPQNLWFVITNFEGRGMQHAMLDIKCTKGVDTFIARILNLRSWDEIACLVLRLMEKYQKHYPDPAAAWKRYIAIFAPEEDFDYETGIAYLYNESNFYSMLLPDEKCQQSYQK